MIAGTRYALNPCSTLTAVQTVVPNARLATPEGLCPRCLMRQPNEGDPSVTTERRAAVVEATQAHAFAPTTPESVATGGWASGPSGPLVSPGESAAPTDQQIDPGRTLDPHDPIRPADGRTEPLARGTIVRYFGDYELQQELGRGGMGVVYKALQISLNRPVALKMIKAGVLADDADLQRFQKEAEAVAGLDHPGIVPVYEVGEHAGERYFSMKLVEGGNLAEQLDTFKANSRAAATLLAETAEAVHHAHMRGILHRDLKPANILVDAEGRPHVTDFGLAKRVEGDVEMTASGAILGTPAYMSPEQASGRRRSITTVTDVYGLGAILYALLTGKPPFGGDSLIETLDAVRTTPPEPPTKLEASTPRDLETICLKCLEKDPRRRYASASALADDLRLARLAADLRASRRRNRARWLWCKRKPAVAALTAAVFLAIVLGTAAVIAVQTSANRLLAKKNLDLRASNTNLYEQRARAENRETQAIDAVKRFRDAVADEPELKNSPALEGLRKRLLKEPLAFFQSLRDRLQADHDTRPEALARLAAASQELGVLTDEIGDKEDALTAYRESLAIRQKLVNANPDVADYQIDLARSLNNIAVLLIATGKTAEALKASQAALAIRQKLADASPSASQLQAELAQPQQHRWSVARYREIRRRAFGLQVGARHLPAACRRQPQGPCIPDRTGAPATTISALSSATPASRPMRSWPAEGRWRSSRSWSTPTPPRFDSKAIWRAATSTSAYC